MRSLFRAATRNVPKRPFSRSLTTSHTHTSACDADHEAMISEKEHHESANSNLQPPLLKDSKDLAEHEQKIKEWRMKKHHHESEPYDPDPYGRKPSHSPHKK